MIKKLSIVCAALTSFLINTNVFADNQKSFVRLVMDGGSVSQSIQMTDGNYAYLNKASIRKISDVLGNRISETSLSFEKESYLAAMAQTSNGFVLAGYAFNDNESSSAILMKVDSEGRTEWKKTFSLSMNSSFHSVVSTSDGGWIVTGGKYPPSFHPVLIKFNSRGDVLWSKSFDSLSYSFRSTPTLDGGVILAVDHIVVDGRVNGVNVIKISGSGEVVWAVTLEMENFWLQSLSSLKNQGYLLVGKGTNQNTLLLVSLNADGTIHSKAAYSLNVPNFSVSSLAQTQDGGVAIGGALNNKSGAYDGLLLKINDRQELIFQKKARFSK